MSFSDGSSGDTLYFKWTSRSGTPPVPTTLAGSPVISIYKDASLTQSTAGVTLTADFDSVTGLNHVSIDTTADATFYANGHKYYLVITTGTVGGTSVVGEVVGEFMLAAAALTAAQIATGVWQDTTSGDFTVSSSIGKSLYTSGVVPGAAGGLFIAGTNAATTITTSLTTHLVGTVDTVTTVTNQLTAAQVATGVWQDATGGDFTVTSSIGKSLYTSGNAPGASGGLFIAGTNAATTITTALTTTFTGNLTGSVGSVTANVNAVLADAVTHGGSTALLQLGSSSGTPAFLVQNSGGDACRFTASGGNGAGFKMAGQGTASGMDVTGGGAAHAVNLHAASGSGGIGLYMVGDGSGAGLTAQGGTNGNGFEATGGGTSGHGMQIVAVTNGQGIRVLSQGFGNAAMALLAGIGSGGVGLAASGNGTGSGISATGGSTGTGLLLTGGSSSGSAMLATANADHAIFVQSHGSAKHGLFITATTNADAVHLVGVGTGHGLFATSGSGATGDGIHAVSIATNGDGFSGIGNGTGVGFRSAAAAVGFGGGSGTVDANIISVNGTMFAGANVPCILADGVAHGGTTASLRLGGSTSTPPFYVTNSDGDAVRLEVTGGTGSGLHTIGFGDFSAGIASQGGDGSSPSFSGAGLRLVAGGAAGAANAGGNALELFAGGINPVDYSGYNAGLIAIGGTSGGPGTLLIGGNGDNALFANGLQIEGVGNAAALNIEGGGPGVLIRSFTQHSTLFDAVVISTNSGNGVSVTTNSSGKSALKLTPGSGGYGLDGTLSPATMASLVITDTTKTATDIVAGSVVYLSRHSIAGLGF